MNTEQASQQWLEAKEIIAKGQALLKEAEVVLSNELQSKEEGSTKNDIGSFNVTTTGKLTRSAKKEDVVALAGKVPEDVLKMVFDWSPKINLTNLRSVQKSEPAYLNELMSAITTKPAKTSIKVELKEEK